MCYLIAMRVEWDGRALELVKPMLVSKLLEHFSLSNETHLVIVNGRLVTEDQKIGKDDEVKFVRVVSGG